MLVSPIPVELAGVHFSPSELSLKEKPFIIVYLPLGGTWKKGNPEIKECLFDHF